MAIAALILFTLLLAIAALHFAWGLGFLWPAKTERELVSLVVGKTGLKKMPSQVQCFAAAGAIFLTGLLALVAGNIIELPWMRNTSTVLALVAACIFLGRGIAGFIPTWRVRFSQQPFATFDRFYYSPFCLAAAAIFLLLVLGRQSLI
jgi:hypothetical protein